MKNAVINAILSAARGIMKMRGGRPVTPFSSSRDQLRAARKMNRVRKIKHPVVNPAGTKMLKRSRKGTLTLKWGV